MQALMTMGTILSVVDPIGAFARFVGRLNDSKRRNP